MQFEVYNRITEKSAKLDSPKIRINKTLGHVSLNVSAGLELNLEAGDHIQFLKFGKSWFVVKSGTDGYKLANNGAAGGLKCYSRIPAGAIATDLKQAENLGLYYLQKTDHEFHGCNVYEFLPVLK